MDKNKNIEFDEKINHPVLRVIDELGVCLGDLTRDKALETARDKKLNLVVIVPNAPVPVAKLCLIDKYLFKLKKEQKAQQRKTIQNSAKKQIKMGIRIDPHDLETKMRQAESFIKDNIMVSFFIKFRRKELPLVNQGIELLKKTADKLSDIAIITKDVSMTNNTATLSIRPKGKNSTTKSKEEEN